jgi:hypothetical protein
MNPPAMCLNPVNYGLIYPLNVKRYLPLSHSHPVFTHFTSRATCNAPLNSDSSTDDSVPT